MTGADDITFSRPLGVARALGAAGLGEDDVLAKTVILTGEQVALNTANGRWCFLNSLRLLCRFVGPLSVVLPQGVPGFEQEVRRLASRLWSRRGVTVLLDGEPLHSNSAAAALSIGFSANRDARWTTINSNGWVTRVSSEPLALSSDMQQDNPLAAMLAASLGVMEVFKRVYEIPSEAAPLLGLTQFSLFELSTSPSGLGPPLPSDITLPDALLVGAGAIGNAIALLLSQLPVAGRLHIVDKQAFERENLGTCMLLDLISWVGESKAERLAAWLSSNSKLSCTGEAVLIADASSGEHLPGMAVDLVFNGLDDVQARHDAQLLWPSVLVDGGINAIGVAVVTHRLDQPSGACLRCTFALQAADERALQAQLTGLSVASLDAGLDRQLTELDVEAAAEANRDWLRQRMKAGKTLCATISEAQQSLGVQFAEGFRPSVPFVASAAAALSVAQALKALLFPDAPFVQRFQMESLFIGPETSVSLHTDARSTCECVAHRRIIEQLVSRRARRLTLTACR